MTNNRERKLWGRKFNVVPQGLDERQIIEFVDVLMKQRDTLLEQIDSLLSYIRLSKSPGEKEDEPTGGSGQPTEKGDASILTKVEQEIQSAMETKEPEPDIQPVVGAAEAEPKSPEVTEAAEADKEGPTLYQGELELAILPPITAVGLLQFERSLRDTFQMKILSTDGSPSKGSLISVLLNGQQPLLQGLNQLPGVKEAVEELDIHTQAGEIPSLFKNKQGKRLWVTLAKGA